MRRKGPGPFGRAAPKSPHQHHHHHGHHQPAHHSAQQSPFQMQQLHLASAAGSTTLTVPSGQYNPVAGEQLPYNSMQRGLADGMNHIAQSIMHSSGRAGIMSVGGGGDAGTSIRADYLMNGAGDLVNSSTGELHTPRRENIPMRPLVLNGQQQQQQPSVGYE